MDCFDRGFQVQSHQNVKELLHSQPCCQVTVALMDKMQVGDASLQEAAKGFAIQLFDLWGVGDPGCQNGVLLLLSKQDRQVILLANPLCLIYTSAMKSHRGSKKDCQELQRAFWCYSYKPGAFGAISTSPEPLSCDAEAVTMIPDLPLTDYCSSRDKMFACTQVFIYAGKHALQKAPEPRLKLVIDRMRPLLKAGDYNTAVEEAVVDLGLILAGGEPKQEAENSYWGLAVFLSIFAGIVGFTQWSVPSLDFLSQQIPLSEATVQQKWSPSVNYIIVCLQPISAI